MGYSMEALRATARMNAKLAKAMDAGREVIMSGDRGQTGMTPGTSPIDKEAYAWPENGGKAEENDD